MIMSDEQTQTPAAETTEPAEPNPVEEWLRTASPDDILKNDRIRGIFGSRIAAERDRIERDLGEKSQREAREAAQKELDDLAQNDIYEFQRRYLSKRDQDRIATELATVKNSTRSEFAANLGRGYQALPEWQNLTAEEQETLARAVTGKGDDDALVAFNAAALDVIAERRAQAKLTKWTEAQLQKEREAIREEEAAKRLKGSARPAMTRTEAAPTGKGWQDLPPGKEFDAAYDKYVLGKGR
jgi:hypothetical protein